MGNYRQHITFAGLLGVAYAWLAFAYAGVHWMYGSVAALLTTMGGLLPDLDSPSGVELRGFTGILGVLVALGVWQSLAIAEPPPAFEFHLWAVVGAYVLVRHGLHKFVARIARHRGISHSLPTCAAWGAIAYLTYPAPKHGHALKLVMGVAVILGFLSHLLLDEVFSVDLKGARVNKAFGTALKLWSDSVWSTLAIYLLLGFLTWRVIELWPENPYQFQPPPPPEIPFDLPQIPKVIRDLQ